MMRCVVFYCVAMRCVVLYPLHSPFCFRSIRLRCIGHVLFQWFYKCISQFQLHFVADPENFGRRGRNNKH